MRFVVAKFEIGDEVWVKLRVGGLLVANDYEVAQRRRSSGVYEYKLRDPASNKLYKEGQWVKQDKLSASRLVRSPAGTVSGQNL
ncbi:hypothetical protein FGG08_006475 [Glutinoglossum americanum]|uniref:Uncharacterized protein n=1 Tax=Glutinoglossum americanum TaxID=1670608 RepID=A0A9P8HW89_9PEZI|nr:hypothetical protein FGG08_006475 [Glutinoglossum americanum]